MHTRAPLPTDRAALTALIRNSEGNPFRSEEISCALELLDAVLAPPEGNTYEALVAFRADEALSYACFGRTPMTEATYDLYWMVTAASARGRGVGKALLGDLETALRARGGQTIRIETSSLEGQGGARRFYEANGYELVGHIRDFYRAGDDLVTLAKRLV